MSQSTSSFSDAFGLHHAIELAVDAAIKARVPVYAETLATALIAKFPDAGLSDAQVLAAILHAAEAAQVSIGQSAHS